MIQKTGVHVDVQEHNEEEYIEVVLRFKK